MWPQLEEVSCGQPFTRRGVFGVPDTQYQVCFCRSSAARVQCLKGVVSQWCSACAASPRGTRGTRTFECEIDFGWSGKRCQFHDGTSME